METGSAGVLEQNSPIFTGPASKGGIPNGIHTFFMKTKIDVVLTDKNGKILYIYKSLKPNRIILPKKHVAYTYEMPEGFVQNLEDKKNISEL